MAYRLGIDVGGTFTDLVQVNDETGEFFRMKTPSTPADPSQGILEGLRRICQDNNVSASEVTHLLHGTTVATNAVLEGKGARVGLLTTQGFRQILHLARSQTPGPLAGWIIMSKPEPPASLIDTREVRERMDARGNVVTPLDEEQVHSVVRDLVESGIESLTVSLINSYANPAHERRVREIIHELYPDLPVTISSDVLPEFREYERTLTACMNSYVRPRVQTYMRNLEQKVRHEGMQGEINILRSDAGLMTVKIAEENPVYAVLSGPSGGVAGALYIARKAGYPNILTFDMGGTSTDVALCEQGQPTIARETMLGYFRVKVPSVNVHSVGAGGGSIAHVPELTKALRVGPQSAGAEPGPACYGKGGSEPTVTDANVVVGHLPPSLLGGEMRLDVEAARNAVAKIATALGLGIEEAAQGILDIVNENMAGALRLVSVQRGYDPRNFALVAFGGAGPMHANAVAKVMGSFPVIVPPSPGLLCATGDLVADFRQEFARTFIRTSDQTNTAEVQGILAELEGEATKWLELEGIPPASQIVSYDADMRYYRQGYEIPIQFTLDELNGNGLDLLIERFNQLHDQYYGFRMEGTRVEIVNLRAIAIGKMTDPALPEGEPDGASDAREAAVEGHQVYFGGEWLPTTIYDRARLRPGHVIQGPAIVTEFDSTTVILPGYSGRIDRYFNILIHPA
ncbi:MAG TPA: hydantoinase/oxoprolinase family protein [Ktedonobacteraceae bacterium]|jgi:N-methylhydantoinase A|nr:hydantoinase/oxoprolinase family protein [Ktedonobacteraceae bacterium]